MTLIWSSIEDYAVANNINVRTARWRVAKGKVTFRTVRSEAGGGKGGLVYQVLMDTPGTDVMPTETSLPALLVAASPLPANGPKAQQWRNFKRMVIAAAMMLEAHSKERGKVISQLAQREWLTPDGDIRRFSERTIRSWIAADLAAKDLARGKRGDAGQRRVLISRPVFEAAKAKIASQTIGRTLSEKELKTLAHAELSRVLVEVKKHADTLRVNLNHDPKTAIPRINKKLNEELAKIGIVSNGKPFEVPMHLFKDWQRKTQLANHFVHNPKAYEGLRSRGMTSTAGMRPMETVQVDATKVDVYYRREDGTPATFYMVTWLDVFTRRVFCHFFEFDKGTGLAQRHVCDSFRKMVEHWGAPEHITADNGSEFRCLEWLEPVIRELQQFSRSPLTISPYEHPKRALTNNRAHNSQAKGMVERAQGVLCRTMFKSIVGWRNSDLMKSKSSNQGKGITCFPGTTYELAEALQAKINEYNALPQKGDQDTLPPNERFERAIQGGWKMTAIDKPALDYAMSDLVEVQIRQGLIRRKRRVYSCPAVAMIRPTGKVWVRVQRFRDGDELPVFLGRNDEHATGIAKLYFGDHPRDRNAAIERRAIETGGKKHIQNQIKSLPRREDIDDSLQIPPQPVAGFGVVISLRDSSRRQVSDAETLEESMQQRLHQKQKQEEDEYIQQTEASKSFWAEVKANEKARAK